MDNIAFIDENYQMILWCAKLIEQHTVRIFLNTVYPNVALKQTFVEIWNATLLYTGSDYSHIVL